MTLADAAELLAYWDESPPIHVAFRAFLEGFSDDAPTAGPRPLRAASSSPEDVAAFVARFRSPSAGDSIG